MNDANTPDTKTMTINRIGRSLLETMVQELRMLPKPWPKLSRSEQDEVIDRARESVFDGVVQAVNLIASDGRAVAEATLKKVVFKNRIVAEFELSKSCPARHQLADSEGELCLIVVADAADYTGDMNGVKGESDQRGLALGHEYALNTDGKGMEPAKSDEVIDIMARALGNVESDHAAYRERGRVAYRDGLPVEAAPMERIGLVTAWIDGWKQEEAAAAAAAKKPDEPSSTGGDAPQA